MQKLKYLAIAGQLREECAALSEGTRMPSERNLSERFRVSPMTVRRALEELEHEGLVVRIGGRGTFTQRPVIAKGDSVTSFTEDMRIRGLVPSTRLLGVEFVEASAAVAVDLKVQQNDRVLQVERLRLANKQPMCLEVAHLPARVGQQIVDSDPHGYESLHELLATFGAGPTAGTRRIRAVALADRESMLLREPVDVPALSIIHVFTHERSGPIQRAESVYRADRYEVHSVIHPA